MPETNTLELVDAALDEGRVTASDMDDRLLQELALMVRDEVRPAPDPDFANEMDAWAAGGFGGPREPSSEARPGGGFGAWFDAIARKLSTPYGLAGAGAVACALVVAIVIVAGSGSGTSNNDGSQSLADSAPATTSESESSESFDSGAGGGSGGAAAEPAPGAAQDKDMGTDQQLAPVPPSETGRQGGAAPGEKPRIARQAQITIETKEGELQNTADQVVALTDRRHGFVLSSNVSDSKSGGRGDFQLQIPADQLNATLRELSELGDVTARSQNGQDVTRSYVSASDRLEAARAERKALLRRLAASKDDAQSQRLRDRLDQNASEINTLRSQIRSLLEQTNYSTVSVTLQEGDGKADDDDGGAAGGTGTDDALDDSLGLLIGSFNWLLRALGVLIPVGIVGGAAYFGARSLRRRRREAVLF